LGCTHYSHIKSRIEKYLPNVKVMDSCEIVANSIKEELTHVSNRSKT